MKKKLDFSAVKIYGRVSELTVLQEAYKRAGDSSCGSEVVLVDGYSGTGKSSLIRKLHMWTQETNGDNNCGYFVSGKFSQLRTTEPYSALAEALNILCDQIIESDDTDETVESFKEAVGSKGKILLNVIPSLNKIMGNAGSEGDNNHAVGEGTAALNQLKFVFKAFLRSVCAVSKNPVVIFLDDLQWSDAASMELMKSVVGDSNSRNMLFVGAFRCNEVNDTHPLSRCIREFDQERRVTRIHLGNLNMETVNELIFNITELKPSETLPLTEIVYHKTNGNIFYVLQFLRMLQEERLLYFSMTTYKWTWDIEKIRNETNLMMDDNVVDLVADKIKRMPFKTRIALQVASCVWSNFDAGLLREIAVHCRENYNGLGRDCTPAFGDDDDMVKLLDVAAEEGLLDKLSGTRYKYSHDRIQQAAYSLIPEGHERDLVHFWIGELLQNMADSPKREEWMDFAAADQLNRGSALITDDKKRVELAKLNLRAGEQAMALSAFVPAVSFLESAIDHLPMETRWGEHYNLCLKLHNVLSETNYCIGDTERVEQVSGEVITNARSFEDKIDAYYNRCRSLLALGNTEEGRRLCNLVLRKLGEPMPERQGKPMMLLECRKLKRMLRGRSDNDLLSLPLMQDGRKIAAMKFCYIAHVGMVKQVTLVAMKMTEMTLRFGVSEWSPLAFANVGEIFVVQGDVQEGYRFGKLALKMAERVGDEQTLARVTGLVYVYLNHWMEPLQKGLDPLLEAHRIGMVNGNSADAFQCILAYQSCYFYSGLPLKTGAEDLLAFSNQMQEYKQHLIRQMQMPVLQCMLNLMGHNFDPLKLTGEVMDQDEFEDRENNPERICVQAIASCRMQLAYYFGNLELATELFNQLQKVSKSEVYAASYLICARTFFFGLVSIALARKTKKRKHKAKALEIIKKVENLWVKRGAVNCLHKLQILQAENASLDNQDTDKVQEAYDIAISSSRRVGFTQDEALANERAGLYFLEHGNEFWASSYLSRADELYSEWGAQAKVDHLKHLHGSLLTQQEERYAAHLRGRKRFSESPAKHHKALPANFVG